MDQSAHEEAAGGELEDNAEQAAGEPDMDQSAHEEGDASEAVDEAEHPYEPEAAGGEPGDGGEASDDGGPEHAAVDEEAAGGEESAEGEPEHPAASEPARPVVRLVDDVTRNYMGLVYLKAVNKKAPTQHIFTFFGPGERLPLRRSTRAITLVTDAVKLTQGGGSRMEVVESPRELPPLAKDLKNARSYKLWMTSVTPIEDGVSFEASVDVRPGQLTTLIMRAGGSGPARASDTKRLTGSQPFVHEPTRKKARI
jgi:hypothetical protein